MALFTYLKRIRRWLMDSGWRRFLPSFLPLAILLFALGGQSARADAVVTNCTQQNLEAAIAVGGIVTFDQSCTILISNTITITGDVTLDGSGQTVTLSANNTDTSTATAEATVSRGLVTEITVTFGGSGYV